MWKDLFEHALAVGGPVHVHVAAEIASLTPTAIRARARREGWWQPYRDVVAPPGTAITSLTWALAALARVRGPSRKTPRAAALTRWSAAALHGVHSGWPTRVEVVVPVDRAPECGRRLHVVRSRTFDASAVTEVDGAAVVPPVWLVRSLGPIADVQRLTDLVVDLVQQRQMTLDELAAEHERHRRYPGRGRVTEVLERLDATGRVDSRIELDVRDRLTGVGIPLDRGQVEVPCHDGVPIHLDLGVAAAKFGIDVQSMLAHATRQQLLTDVRRANQLARVEDDWRVIQATWEDLDEGWHAFVALVREVLSAQSLRHLGVPWPLAHDLDPAR